MQYVLNENGSVSVQGVQKKKKKNKTSNVSSNTQTIRTNDTNDTRTVKTSKSETITFNNNDIRTIKTESPKKQGIIGQTGQVLESGLSGAFGGLTSIADVPFQEAQEQAQKGKKIKTQDDLVKEGIKGIARSLVPAYNMIEGNKEVTKKVKDLFKDKKKTTTEKIVGTGLAALNNEGVDNTYQGFKNAFKMWGAVNPNLDKQIANIQGKIDAPAQQWQEKVQEENAQLDKPFQIASDVSGVIGNMAPAALGTYLTKDPNVGRVILAASAKGQSTKDALQRGANIETANDVGLAKGLTEVGTEMATGGLNFLGKGALDDVAKGFIDKKVGKPMLNFIGKKMLGIAGENAEEVASDLIGNLIDRGAIDPNATYTKEDFLNTLLMTTLSTGAMNTLSGGYGRNAYRQNIAEMQESRGINGNNLNTINNNVPSTQQVREVNEIQQRAQNGEISYEQANQQLAQVQDGTYQQNQLIESMASQEVERIQQAVETGQMSPAEASQEIQAVNNTLTSERERINQPQQEIKAEARETKSSENKAEKVETSKTEVKEQKKISPLDILTKDERQQYDKINEKRVYGQPLSQEDKDTLNSFQKKWNNYKEEQQRKTKNVQENKSNIKYEDLSKDASSTRYDKNMYAKAKNTKMDMSNYDKVMDFIIPNKRGNYSREQILTLAEELGKKSKAKTGAELKQEAINYWVNKEPFKKTDSKTKYLKIEEFLKSYYKGAGVGTKIENKVETKKVETKKAEPKKVEPKKVETKETQTEKFTKPTNTKNKVLNFRNSVENENIKDKDGFYKAVEKIIKDKDYNVILDSSITNEKGQSVNALITNENGVTIKINPKSERAGEILLMHEVTHGIETKEMRKLIMDYAKNNSKFNEALEDLKKTYGTEDVTPEVVADISGQLLGNQEFINSLSVENPSLFKRILDALTSLKNKLTGNSKYENFVKDLEVKWQKAYRESNQSNFNKSLKESAMYSQNAQITDNEGRPITKDQKEYFKNTTVVNDAGNLITVFHTTTNPIIQFNEFNPVGTPRYHFGEQVVNFYTNSKRMSASYADYYYEMAETRKLNNIEEAQQWLDEIGVGDLVIEGNNVYDGNEEPALSYKNTNELLRNIKSDIQRDYGNKVKLQYEGYLNIENPFVVDVGGREWNEISRTIVKEMPETIDKVEKYKDELYKLVKESKHKHEIASGKASRLKHSIDKIFNSTTNDGIDFLYEYGMLQDGLNNYNNMYEIASKIGLELPSPETKIRNITNDKIVSEIENSGSAFEKELLDTSLEDFIDNNKSVFQEASELKSETSWFANNYKNIIGDNIKTHYLSAREWFELSEDKFTELAKDRVQSGEMETNHVIKYIIAENNTLDSKYDGVIFRNVKDWGDGQYHEDFADVFVSFNSNQFKAWDNKTPTSDPDIRYSKNADKWQQFLNEYFKERGTRTYFQDNKGETITATNSNNQEVKLKEKNGVYTRQDVVDEVKNIENQFKNQTLKAKNGEKVSNFYSNITEKAQFIEPETRESLKSERSLKFYKGVTNEQALQEAVDIIGTTPTSQARALHNFLTKQDQFTATDMAEGWVFLKQYQDVGNYDAMASVAKKMREMGTKSGQAIQMLGLEARLTPEGMYRFAVNELAQAEEKYNKQKGRTKKDIEQHRKNFQLTPEETEFIKSQMEKVQGMEEGRARDIEVAKINKMLTDKLPHTKGQSLKAWMRISMLFNPKTQVRNIMGNALITPVNALSDVASGAVDRMVAKKTGARTIGGPSLGGLVSYTKGGVRGIGEAWQDYRMGIDTKNINQDRFDIGQGKQFNEQHRGPLKGVRNFVAKQLNKTNDLLAFVMDAGDRFFLQGSVENSLYNQQKLNNTKEITKDMYDLAENEGLQRTWNDNNQFTKAVLNIRRAINDIGGLMHVKVGDYGLGDLMIPFAKTPANLTKAIVDYSPAGFLTAITEGKNLKRAIETGNYSLQQQHDFSQAVGKATAGTLLYALGISLAKAKITTGDSDEDKDLKNFMRYNLGIQPYSIKIGNKSFTYDWAQPVAAPFAITADIQKGMSEEMTPAQAIQQFLTTGFNILTEQSFLSGINEVLNDNDGLLHGIEQQVINMPATAVPTLLKQFTDMTDGTKRQTYSKEGMTENAKKYAQSKIPTESKKLAPQVDVLGNEIQKYGGDNNAFNVFLNPSNTEKGKSNDVSKEIYALYNATGDKTIIPKKVDYTITKDGKKKILTTQEMEKWQKASGKYVTDNVRKAMNTPKYQRMSDVDKATVINKIVNYSYMKAKSEVFDLPISSYYSAISKAESKGIPMYDYYISKIKEDKK